MSFAKVTIVGNLTRDPETRYTQNGALNVQFGIAADGRKKGENTTFFRVTAWDKDAERIVSMMERGYIAKGKSLYVEGQLESRSYESNGEQRTSLDVTLTDWQFVGGGQQQGTENRTYDYEGQRAYDGTPLNSVPF